MMESTLGIIGIFFLPIIMVILIVWFKSDENRKRNRLQAELYAKALEKGQEIPADIFAPPPKQVNYLNRGIICIAAGLGISLFLWLATNDFDRMRAASLGIIPFFIGIGYLVIYFLNKKNGKTENAG